MNVTMGILATMEEHVSVEWCKAMAKVEVMGHILAQGGSGVKTDPEGGGTVRGLLRCILPPILGLKA